MKKNVFIKKDLRKLQCKDAECILVGAPKMPGMKMPVKVSEKIVAEKTSEKIVGEVKTPTIKIPPQIKLHEKLVAEVNTKPGQGLLTGLANVPPTDGRFFIA